MSAQASRSSSRDALHGSGAAGMSSAFKMTGASIQVRQREAFEMLAARVKVLERKVAAQKEYIKVMERDTAAIRMGSVVPKEVVDHLEDHFAHFESEAKRVPALEDEILSLRQTVDHAAAALEASELENKRLRAELEAAKAAGGGGGGLADVASEADAAAAIHPTY